MQEEGAPELVAAVEQGRVAVSTAAEIAKTPREKQVEIVAKGKDEILRAAAEIRQQRAMENASKRAEAAEKSRLHR